MTTRAALLQVLKERPGHGYELVGRVRERTGGLVVLNNHSLYPALRSLAAEGLATSRDEKALRGVRTTYQITSDGERELERMRAVVFSLFGAVP